MENLANTLINTIQPKYFKDPSDVKTCVLEIFSELFGTDENTMNAWSKTYDFLIDDKKIRRYGFLKRFGRSFYKFFLVQILGMRLKMP